jgi:small subunit ribosomal protein S20
MKTAVKRVMDAIAKGDAAEAKKLLPLVMKRIDKAARRRVIHPNAAARKKSQVARALAPKKA